jgi:hypothetical protein
MATAMRAQGTLFVATHTFVNSGEQVPQILTSDQYPQLFYATQYARRAPTHSNPAFNVYAVSGPVPYHVYLNGVGIPGGEDMPEAPQGMRYVLAITLPNNDQNDFIEILYQSFTAMKDTLLGDVDACVRNERLITFFLDTVEQLELTSSELAVCFRACEQTRYLSRFAPNFEDGIDVTAQFADDTPQGRLVFAVQLIQPNLYSDDAWVASKDASHASDHTNVRIAYTDSSQEIKFVYDNDCCILWAPPENAATPLRVSRILAECAKTFSKSDADGNRVRLNGQAIHIIAGLLTTFVFDQSIKQNNVANMLAALLGALGTEIPPIGGVEHTPRMDVTPEDMDDEREIFANDVNPEPAGDVTMADDSNDLVPYQPPEDYPERMDIGEADAPPKPTLQDVQEDIAVQPMEDEEPQKEEKRPIPDDENGQRPLQEKARRPIPDDENGQRPLGWSQEMTQTMDGQMRSPGPVGEPQPSVDKPSSLPDNQFVADAADKAEITGAQPMDSDETELPNVVVVTYRKRPDPPVIEQPPTPDYTQEEAEARASANNIAKMLVYLAENMHVGYERKQVTQLPYRKVLAQLAEKVREIDEPNLTAFTILTEIAQLLGVNFQQHVDDPSTVQPPKKIWTTPGVQEKVRDLFPRLVFNCWMSPTPVQSESQEDDQSMTDQINSFILATQENLHGFTTAISSLSADTFVREDEPSTKRANIDKADTDGSAQLDPATVAQEKKRRLAHAKAVVDVVCPHIQRICNFFIANIEDMAVPAQQKPALYRTASLILAYTLEQITTLYTSLRVKEAVDSTVSFNKWCQSLYPCVFAMEGIYMTLRTHLNQGPPISPCRVISTESEVDGTPDSSTEKKRKERKSTSEPGAAAAAKGKGPAGGFTNTNLPLHPVSASASSSAATASGLPARVVPTMFTAEYCKELTVEDLKAAIDSDWMVVLTQIAFGLFWDTRLPCEEGNAPAVIPPPEPFPGVIRQAVQRMETVDGVIGALFITGSELTNEQCANFTSRHLRQFLEYFWTPNLEDMPKIPKADAVANADTSKFFTRILHIALRMLMTTATQETFGGVKRRFDKISAIIPFGTCVLPSLPATSKKLRNAQQIAEHRVAMKQYWEQLRPKSSGQFTGIAELRTDSSLIKRIISGNERDAFAPRWTLPRVHPFDLSSESTELANSVLGRLEDSQALGSGSTSFLQWIASLIMYTRERQISILTKEDAIKHIAATQAYIVKFPDGKDTTLSQAFANRVNETPLPNAPLDLLWVGMLGWLSDYSGYAYAAILTAILTYPDAKNVHELLAYYAFETHRKLFHAKDTGVKEFPPKLKTTLSPLATPAVTARTMQDLERTKPVMKWILDFIWCVDIQRTVVVRKKRAGSAAGADPATVADPAAGGDLGQVAKAKGKGFLSKEFVEEEEDDDLW